MSESGAEQHFIKEAFASNWVAPLGPNVDAFEKNLEDFVNAKLIKDPPTPKCKPSTIQTGGCDEFLHGFHSRGSALVGR